MKDILNNGEWEMPVYLLNGNIYSGDYSETSSLAIQFPIDINKEIKTISGSFITDFGIDSAYTFSNTISYFASSDFNKHLFISDKSNLASFKEVILSNNIKKITRDNPKYSDIIETILSKLYGILEKEDKNYTLAINSINEFKKDNLLISIIFKKKSAGQIIDLRDKVRKAIYEVISNSQLRKEEKEFLERRIDLYVRSIEVE